MEFKKCMRCGSFFASSDNICCNCVDKDKADISKLKSYLDENLQLSTCAQSLSLDTGIAVQHVNRYLESNEFSTFKNILNENNDVGNISII